MTVSYTIYTNLCQTFKFSTKTTESMHVWLAERVKEIHVICKLDKVSIEKTFFPTTKEGGDFVVEARPRESTYISKCVSEKTKKKKKNFSPIRNSNHK